MPSPSPSVKIQIFSGKGYLLGNVDKLYDFKSLLTMLSIVLPLHLKQTFPPIIWIFTEGEGDGMEFRLPFKIYLLYWYFVHYIFCFPCEENVPAV